MLQRGGSPHLQTLMVKKGFPNNGMDTPPITLLIPNPAMDLCLHIRSYLVSCSHLVNKNHSFGANNAVLLRV